MSMTPPLFQPALPARIERVFDPLCRTLESVELHTLTQQVQGHAAIVRDSQRHNEFIDANLAERMAAILGDLLGAYEAFIPAQQALIAGAARYFVLSGDASPDMSSLLGFDDDILVLNHVLNSIGRDDLRIEA